MKKIISIATISTLAMGTAHADTADTDKPASNHDITLESVLVTGNDGCLTGPMEQFGRYLGDWNIQDWQLSQDGKTWTEGKGARWNFVCIGNGLAVQDYWMPNGGGVGTNLRLYDPKKESWEITWSATGAPGMTHITAKEDENGNIVMHYVSPKPTPARRITFLPPTADGWDWKLEFSTDGEQTWFEVYKIKATRR